MRYSTLFFLALPACAGLFLDADLYPEDLPQATRNTFCDAVQDSEDAHSKYIKTETDADIFFWLNK